MEKIILFYKFTPVSDPEMARLWQQELCNRLELKGRIIISPHGINGTLGGKLDHLRAYKSAMNKTAVFKGIDYKWSNGGAADFPRLSIKVRNEVVTFHAADELVLGKEGIKNGGQRLKPRELHDLIKKRGDDVVFLDGRNKFEARIGKFKNAVVPDVTTSREFIREIEDPKYEDLKQKAVVTYCTGGIRCEILTALMKNRGFNEVYQLDGGIVRYGEEYGDDGLWEGALHVFDNRMVQRFSDESRDVGTCDRCSAKTSTYVNCAQPECNRLMLLCERCVSHDMCDACAAQPQAQS